MWSRVDTKLSSCGVDVGGSDETDPHDDTMRLFDTHSPDQSVVSAGSSDVFNKSPVYEDSTARKQQQQRHNYHHHHDIQYAAISNDPQSQAWSKRPSSTVAISSSTTNKRIEKTSKRGRSRKWTEEEDLKVKDLVNKHGAGNWVKIATDLGSKTPKQIHARYRDYLRPGLVDSVDKPWTEEETRKLATLHQEYGNSWSQLATLMAGRSANSIK